MEGRGGCGNSTGLAAMGLPVCCSLGCLPFVQIRASDTAKFFLSLFFFFVLLFRQIECFFGCHIEFISDLMPEDIRYEI